MYRRSEFTLFTILYWVSTLFALLAFGLAAASILNHMVLLRDLSLVFVVFSLLFQVQIYIYKTAVMEKRMLYLVGASEQHFRIAKKRDPLQLIVYFILFWAALMAVIFAYSPPPV